MPTVRATVLLIRLTLFQVDPISNRCHQHTTYENSLATRSGRRGSGLGHSPSDRRLPGQEWDAESSRGSSMARTGPMVGTVRAGGGGGDKLSAKAAKRNSANPVP